MPRPKLLQNPKSTTLYLSEDIYAKLRNIASAQNKSVSQLVREIIEKHLSKHG
jgi:predicted DNA-binding protein